MWQPNNLQWWLLAIVGLFVVFVWPPENDRSLAVKFVNWSVDPRDELPVLPGPLAPGLGDDPVAVEAHSQETQHYDALYARGGWTRTRLELKVARDPFNKSTERQLLLGIAVLIVLVVWRLGGPKPSP